MRNISSREGISNNSILSLGQDVDGMIFFGSCDGLNLWDGNQVEIYPEERTGALQLSGNLIEEILPTTDSLLWMRTNYGLDLYGRGGVIKKCGQFQGMYRVTARRSDEVLVLSADDRLYTWDKGADVFVEILAPGYMRAETILAMALDSHDDVLWTVARDGIYSSEASCSGGKIMVSDSSKAVVKGNFSVAFASEGGFFVIDSGGYLHWFSHRDRTLAFLCDISKEILSLGPVSDIIMDGEDLMVAFLYNGVVSLEKKQGSKTALYSRHRLDIRCGVFSLLKDRNQDIVWIGTDGQGVLMYAHDPITFTSYTYDRLPYSLSMPVRALEVDSRGTLWAATKGEGILVVKNFYNCDRITYQNSFMLDRSNSALSSETVYAFEESSRNLMWIGSEGDGLNWWSYKDEKVHVLGGDVPANLRYVHGIFESHRDTLYVATVGCGVFRLTIGGSDDSPYIKEWKNLYFGDSFRKNSFFFSVYQDTDGSLMFGNRGGGLVRYVPSTGGSESFTFSSGRDEIADDVWTVCRASDSSLWVGTTWGMFPSWTDALDFCPVRNTVHSILEDAHGCLWASTNRGLVKYNLRDSSTVTYGYSYGLSTIEYSDGAAFADRSRNVLLFGGTNGFVTITQDSTSVRAYNPPVQFRSARVGDSSVTFGAAAAAGAVSVRSGHSHFRQDDIPSLSVPAGERLHSVDVVALDYVNGSNYIYSYRLDRRDGTWLETPSRIALGSLSPGRHILQVRYVNPVTGYRSPEYSMRIRVIPPWYKTVVAKVSYLLAFLGFFALLAIEIRRRRQARSRERNRRMEALRKEEMLESKVHLLESVAQELSAPLTMISGPCQQIIQYSRSDGFVKSHSEQILRQSHKIYDMLSLFRDFNESGALEPRMFSVSAVMDKVTGSYKQIAQTNGIDLSVTVPRQVAWCSDSVSVASVANILLATAVTRTKKQGKVDFTVEHDASALKISVRYDDKTSHPDDVRMDRYEVMERLNEGKSSNSFRNELRLAACSSIVTRLGGKMSPEIDGSRVTFAVTLPYMSSEHSAGNDEAIGIEKDGSMQYALALEQVPLKEYQEKVAGLKMYIVGHDAEMMNFVADLFTEDFNVKLYRGADKAKEALLSTHPDIMVVENMNSRTDILDMIRSVKSDKVTSYIPIILLEAFKSDEDRITGVETGADIFVTLPFDMKYLKAVVSQLLFRMRTLQSYWQSGMSAYELTGGKQLYREDKEFIDKLFRIINENISDSSLTTASLAEKMGLGLRSMYYKLDGLLTVTPSNIIKVYRIRYAAQLLATTNMSVDEIIYKCGFANRGTFFRQFSSHYGMTPKNYRRNSGLP